MWDKRPTKGEREGNIAALGGVAGAVLTSACCIGPLVLVSLGASGAWIGGLTALNAYQPVFIAATVAFLGTGFWQVYGKRRPACDDAAFCHGRASRIIVQTTLWAATLLIVFAVTIDLWAPFFY